VYALTRITLGTAPREIVLDI
jgi:hypothetical protein